jgi:predicted nucleotidyltransferase
MVIEKLLKLLNENNAEFVIIGATAFPLHGYSRSTLDVDLFIKADLGNAAKVLSALKQFGYDTEDLSESDLISSKILIREYKLETDLHPFVKGISFSEVWNNKVEGTIGEQKAFFASLDDLIMMKKAAGRPKDIEDLRALELIKERMNR